MLDICWNVLSVKKTKSVLLQNTLKNGQVPSHTYKAEGKH